MTHYIVGTRRTDGSFLILRHDMSDWNSLRLLRELNNRGQKGERLAQEEYHGVSRRGCAKCDEIEKLMDTVIA
jgi:hypothetical protein